MDDRLIPILGVVGLFFLLGLVLVFVRIVRRKRTPENDEREKHILEGIKRRELDRNPVTGEVFSTCSICRGRATDYPPATDKSWMDSVPMLNWLFSLPPRYVIVDNTDDGYTLCKIHKQVTVKKLEEFHALLRAERARFNAGQEEKVASMGSGGLHLMVMKQFQEAQDASTALAEQLNLPDVRVIPSPKESHPQLTMVSTSSVSEPEPEPELEEDVS